MMNRNEYRARKKRRSYGESNQERRTKALEVYRKVDKDTSGSLAAGIIAMLGNAHESDNFPQLKKIEHTHRLQILDALSVKIVLDRVLRQDITLGKPWRIYDNSV